MCKCTPEIRTPFCGKPGCEVPPQITRLQPPNSQLAAVSDAVDRLLSAMRRNGLATLVCAMNGKIVRVDDEVSE